MLGILKRFLLLPYTLVFDRCTPEFIKNSVRGIHYYTTYNHLKKATWKKFVKKTRGKKLCLIGADEGLIHFVENYGSDFTVHRVYDLSGSRIGRFVAGYRVHEISELFRENLSGCTILITTGVYNEYFADMLERHRIHDYFSYIQMEIKKPKYFLSKHAYHLRYRVVPQIGSIFRNYFWFDFCGMLRKLHFPPLYNPVKEIRKLKNSQAGKRCFIVATGPSLTLEDVELLKDEITFGVNGIIRLFNKTEWRPTYYAMCDRNVHRDYIDSGTDMALDEFCHERAFMTAPMKKYYKESSSVKKTLFIPYSYLNHEVTARNMDFRYSEDLIFGGYNAATVVNFCINIAQYMGFSEIFLIGTDCTSSGDKQYFDDYKQEQKTNFYFKTMLERNSIQAYTRIREEMEKRNVKVYNATRGGALEVFPRVALEDALDNSI